MADIGCGTGAVAFALLLTAQVGQCTARIADGLRINDPVVRGILSASGRQDRASAKVIARTERALMCSPQSTPLA